ncbi:CmcJ/NvfI family oxidoreductase [Paraburkholderia domus]|jgi:hypothetical protein|uniref:CmcJ/NvfI family oxidoreductase n=1 Tax=Paraburkholderia domus TaxID=2793075 RepID=UPI001912BC82|nr:CmcJ/NvfI family oxidoreductase [Paraburkholderia domus]MBK5065682.1 hypothetical protein [Burkholderia sp. R-70199]CAE6960816.1 hypothetical protein R70199_07305 [Paraburkholderia domus]
MLRKNPTVDAEIGFLAPNSSRRPIFHDLPCSDDFLPLKQHRVTISALRDKRESYKLDTHGVEILNASGLDIDRPLDLPRLTYLRMLEQIVTGSTGASCVMALGNGVVRRSERARRHLHDGTTVLGRFAHCDFSRSPAGSSLWVQKMLGADDARKRLARRYAIYNVWQSISEPPQDTPLAFCDPASVEPSDAVGCDQVIHAPSGERVPFELQLYRYAATQRWFYFPDLRCGELLVFTGYDSDAERPQGIAHAAFTDPSCPADATPRESIDERLIAFFD